ncbi:MAG TPA: hypothetical protein GXZ38_06050 [Spirochaetales bacterium]|nr:hypothetical protein [Spirochaetales bacterium]
MKKWGYLFFFLLVVGSLLWGANTQEIIPLSSPLYRQMDRLYILEGHSRPSSARPWSVNEASLILSRIENRSPLYEAIEAILEESLRFSFSDNFQADVSVDLNIEIYTHSNGEDFNSDRDWVYSFEERKPLLKLNFEFLVGNFFYLFTDLQYGRNRFTDRDTLFSVGGPSGAVIGSIIDSETKEGKIITSSWPYSQTFLTNILWPTHDLDMQLPKRAIFSVGGKQWNFNLSRDKTKWGHGKSGNLIVDDHTDFQEFAKLNVFTNIFKYEWLNLFLETNPSYRESQSSDSEFRIFMTHRLEFRILEKVAFSISENIMYRNDLLSLQYLNPAFIYHNLNSSTMFNAIAHAEVDYTFYKGFNLYGQTALDQATAPNEPAGQAPAFGVIGGLEYTTELWGGYLSSSVEYVYISPAMYRRSMVDFLMFRRYPTNVASSGGEFYSHIDYIGYKWGGDLQALQGELIYEHLKWGEIGVRIFGIQQGEVDYFTPNNVVTNTYATAPSGTVSETGIISIWGKSATFLNYPPLATWFQLDLIGRKGAKGDIQFTLGASASF